MPSPSTTSPPTSEFPQHVDGSLKRSISDASQRDSSCFLSLKWFNLVKTSCSADFECVYRNIICCFKMCCLTKDLCSHRWRPNRMQWAYTCLPDHDFYITCFTMGFHFLSVRLHQTDILRGKLSWRLSEDSFWSQREKSDPGCCDDGKPTATLTVVSPQDVTRNYFSYAARALKLCCVHETFF